MGLTSTYEVETNPLGTVTTTDVDPAGRQTVSTEDNYGTGTDTYPDGTVVNKVMGPDPRFGMLSPVTSFMSVTTPSGLSYTLAESRTSSSSSAGGSIFDFSTLTDSLNVNGNLYISSYDASSRTLTDTTPMGRQETTILNNKGKVVSSQTAGLLPINFGYDTLGRLNSISQGTGAEARVYNIDYDYRNRISGIIDPMSRGLSFVYDQAGRVTQETLPDGRVIGFNYDKNGNVSSIVPPGRPEHKFDYTPVDLTKEYSPPDLGIGNVVTNYSYDLDKRLTEEDQPAGSTIAPSEDNTESTGFTYDGSLLTSTTWSGVVNGTVGFTYNNDFNVSSEIVSGASVNFTYDKDGLLTGAGALLIERDPDNGLVTGTTLGNVSDSWAYNGFGEPASYTAIYNGSILLSEKYTRDNLGRITEKVEIIGGVADTFDYVYDQAGRLTDVQKDGVPISHYEYDSNGNRLSYSSGGLIINGTYDAQDRILTYGNYSYTYTDNGELASISTPFGTTQYGYDDFGNLISVIQPDGTKIEYVVDGQNRRIGKKVNGVLVQGFLYTNQLRPITELDGNGNIVSRFVYGTRINVPDYMIKNGATYQIITDHLGSPRLVVDVSSGIVVQQMSYDEFGNVIQDTNPGFQPFGFAGGLYDRDTGLVRFGARDYDPLTGRWTAKGSDTV